MYHFFLKKHLRYAISILILLNVSFITVIYIWACKPIQFSSTFIEVTIRPHSTLPMILRQLHSHGIELNQKLFILMSRFLNLDKSIKHGHYKFKNSMTPYQLLLKLARGSVEQNNLTNLTVIEGWTFNQMREEIDRNSNLLHDTKGLSEIALLNRIGAVERKAEGLFFPDTYLFKPGTHDLDIYRKAYKARERTLQEAWKMRDTNLPYRTPYEALIVASLIEKEVSKDNERYKVASVFVNRLRLGMPLQTDPSVAYGLGLTASLGKKLHHQDLNIDTPYNTYTHLGIPPTPISLPGIASIQAALHPIKDDALYFVARGDGSSQFSNSLNAHNRAVHIYQRR